MLTASAQQPHFTDTFGQANPVLMYRNTDTTSSGVSTTASDHPPAPPTLCMTQIRCIRFLYQSGSDAVKPYSNYMMTFDVTKISGTGTARVYPQASNDGKTWRNINTGMIGTDGVNSDTLTIAAAGMTATAYSYSSTNGQPVYRPATNTTVFYVNSQRWLYFRVKIVGWNAKHIVQKL